MRIEIETIPRIIISKLRRVVRKLEKFINTAKIEVRVKEMEIIRIEDIVERVTHFWLTRPMFLIKLFPPMGRVDLIFYSQSRGFI